MRGYILADIGKTMWSNDVPEPEMGPRDAIVKPVVVSPCTTDLHMINTMPLPFLKGKPMGHEMAGVVECVGSEVRDFKPGDRVAVPAGLQDWMNLDVQDGLLKFHDVSAYQNSDPKVGGVFAERFRAIDADLNIAHIPENVSWEQAVALTDMAATAFEAVNVMDIDYGDTVVILGIGAVGLMGVCAAKLKGAARIIGIGSRPVSIKVAWEYGATDIVSYKDGDVVEQVFALTGKPVDRVLVCGGASSDVIGQAMRMIKLGGIVVNLACFFDDQNFVIPGNTIGWGFLDKTLKTVQVRTGRRFMERLLDLVSYGRLKPELITTPVLHGMDRIPEALEMMGGNNREAIKPVIFFD